MMAEVRLFAEGFRTSFEALNVGHRHWWAVVKARCYGLGLEAIPFIEKLSPTGYCVATIPEAADLRAKVSKPILVLNDRIDEQTIGAYVTHRLLPLAYSPETILLLQSRQIRYHLILNTGMNRLGLDPTGDYHHPLLEGIHSHYAAPDVNESVTQQQVRLFNQAALKHQRSERPLTLAASATGALRSGLATEENAARVGLGLYGASSFTLSGTVLAKHDLKPGETVNYGMAWMCEEPTQVAVVSVGYADGLHRAYGFNGGTLFCPQRNKHFEIIGTVCMDLCTVRDPDRQLRIGDELIAMGPQVPAAKHARISGTNEYEILTHLSSRAPRRW